MEKRFEAVYENGVLRPLTPLALVDAQRVQVTIAEPDADVAAYFDASEWAASKHDDISLEEVRAALSSIEGSLSDAVSVSREERF
jgi:predicted DNA-binding antitoxin AbrB/MazE fold protein